ncbi:MAG: hypothetical protein AB7G11_02745 [Phycisphaerales bacterium]
MRLARSTRLTRILTGWPMRVALSLVVALAFPLHAYAATVSLSFQTAVTASAVTTETSGATSTISVRLPDGQAPLSFTNGTGAMQLNKFWIRKVALSASTPVTLDLTALTSGQGDTSFAAVKFLAIYNETSTATYTVVVGNGTNPFAGPLSAGTTTITIDPLGSVTFFSRTAAGWAVTNSANDGLKLDPGGNAVNVTVCIGGI